jgi:hypothetical protein
MPIDSAIPGVVPTQDRQQENLHPWECMLIDQRRCPHCFSAIIVESKKVCGLWHAWHTCAECGAIYHTGQYLCPSRVQKK